MKPCIVSYIYEIWFHQLKMNGFPKGHNESFAVLITDKFPQGVKVHFQSLHLISGFFEWLYSF